MRVLLVMLLLAGCASSGPVSDAVTGPVSDQCQSEANRDPTVRLLRMKGAGAEVFAREHADDLRIALNDALQACRTGAGSGPRGGVERQRR